MPITTSKPIEIDPDIDRLMTIANVIDEAASSQEAIEPYALARKIIDALEADKLIC